VARPCDADAAAVLLAKTHLSKEASDPVALPSKMYVNPGSGGGGTYWAAAGAAADAMHPARNSPASPVRCTNLGLILSICASSPATRTSSVLEATVRRFVADVNESGRA
jgi:hypothetical protein